MHVDKKKYLLIIARQCLTGAEVSQMSGIKIQNLNRILNGGSTSPATVGYLAKALGVDVTEIIKEEG